MEVCVTLLLIFILFASATSIVTILNTNIQHNIDDADRRGDRAIKVTEMGSLTRGKSIRILNYIMYGDQKFIDEYRERQEKFNVLEADLRERMDTEGEKELFERIRENDIRLNDLFDQIIQAADSENTTLVDQLAIEAGNVRAETVDLLEKLREQNLNKVVEVSNSIANGDLTVDDIKYDGKDEIGRIAQSINSMSENLRQIIQSISGISETVNSQSEELSQSANEVSAGSQQIATTMQDLASGTESQASAASELSASMENFTVIIQETNSNGEVIRQSSTEVLGMTDEGSSVMEMSIKQMDVIDSIVNVEKHLLIVFLKSTIEGAFFNGLDIKTS